MFDVGIILQVLMWGVILGCIYILIASGLNLIFGVMKLVNFAHGELMMMGGYASYWITTLLGLNPYIAIVASMGIIGVLGVIIERICFRPVLGTSKLNEILLSLGLIYVLQHSAAMLWTDYPRGIHSPFEFTIIEYGALRIGLDWLIAGVITFIIMVGFYLLLRKTKVGRAMRATSQNRSAAMLMGINVGRINSITFGLGAAMAAAAGTLIAITASITPYSGAIPGIKAFAIIVLGGLGSPIGAIVGGLIFGLVESNAIFFLGATWRDAIGFLLLIIVLVIRPTGIFGEKERG